MKHYGFYLLFRFWTKKSEFFSMQFFFHRNFFRKSANSRNIPQRLKIAFSQKSASKLWLSQPMFDLQRRWNTQKFRFFFSFFFLLYFVYIKFDEVLQYISKYFKLKSFGHKSNFWKLSQRLIFKLLNFACDLPSHCCYFFKYHFITFIDRKTF